MLRAACDGDSPPRSPALLPPEPATQQSIGAGDFFSLLNGIAGRRWLSGDQACPRPPVCRCHAAPRAPALITQARTAPARRLVEDTPEECLKNNSLLIDTDPRHVGDTPLEELELPGVTLPAGRPSSSTNKGRASSSMKGKSSDLKKDGESKSAVSYMTPEQIVAEEAALQVLDPWKLKP